MLKRFWGIDTLQSLGEFTSDTSLADDTVHWRMLVSYYISSADNNIIY